MTNIRTLLNLHLEMAIGKRVRAQFLPSIADYVPALQVEPIPFR